MNFSKSNHSLRVRPQLSVFACLLFCLCFFSCTQEEDSGKQTSGTAVSFMLADIRSEVTPVGTTRSALAKDTRVRVVAYKTGGQSSANYVTTKDYIASEGGSLVSADGTDLHLADGSYDFYVFTPDLVVATAGNTPSVSVPQQVDFAVSLTENQTVATQGVPANIVLSPLVRKCAKVNFAIELSEGIAPTITECLITGVTLTAMPGALTATGTALPAGSGNETLALSSALFSTDTTIPRKSSGSAVLLPKTSGSFTLGINAQFNGATDVTTLFPAAPIPAMAWESGKEYTFTLRLIQDQFGNITAELWVSVSNWNTNDQDMNLGGIPAGPVYTQLIGEWKSLVWGDVNLGGIPTGPVITGVSGWWNNVNYNPHLGNSDMNSNN